MNEDKLKLALILLITANMHVNEDGYPALNFGREKIILKSVSPKMPTHKVIETFLEIIHGKLQYTVD
jgi:hypothetical protein